MSLLFALSCTVVVCECMLDLFPVLHNTFITCSTKVLFVLQVMKLQQRSESICKISRLSLTWISRMASCSESLLCCKLTQSLVLFICTIETSTLRGNRNAVNSPPMTRSSRDTRITYRQLWRTERYMKWLTKEWSRFRWVLIRSGMLFVRQEGGCTLLG